ncbi:MAG: spore cortex-lytic enzyme [Clostridia bacterium]
MSILTPQAATYKQGSSGAVVREIQTKLINWGYLDGAADGIYGSATTSAVKLFQQRNELTVDGIVGTQTLTALGISSGTTASRDEDLYLLARIISAEARGEPYEGQVAVGAVVLNRVSHPSFPNTFAGVIYQKGAFTAIVDGQFNEPIAESAYRAAQDALNGWDPTGGAIYYYNPVKSTSSWIFTREVITVIGNHRFAI